LQTLNKLKTADLASEPTETFLFLQKEEMEMIFKPRNWPVIFFVKFNPGFIARSE